MKRIISIVFLIWFVNFWLVPDIFAQSNQSVQASFHILPPYSPYFADYGGANAHKVLMTVHNLFQINRDVKLSITITGNNGFTAHTRPNYQPVQPLTLIANTPVQLNGTAIADLLDFNTLEITGGDKDQLIRTQRLPEGEYDVCLQVLDMENTPLSDKTCSYMLVAHPEPPVLISPLPNDTVRIIDPQFVNFVWMLPGNIPEQGTMYTLQIAEMPASDMNPNQVLDGASFPLLSHSTNQFTYLYSLSDQPLQPGKAYAWRVKAETLSDLQTLYKNNGYSAAQVFYVEPQADPFGHHTANSPSVVLYHPTAITDTIIVSPSQDFYARWGMTDTSDNSRTAFRMHITEQKGKEVLRTQPQKGQLYFQHATADFLSENKRYTLWVEARKEGEKNWQRSEKRSFVFRRGTTDDKPTSKRTLKAKVMYTYEQDGTKHPYIGDVYIHKINKNGQTEPTPLAQARTGTDGMLSTDILADTDTSTAYGICLNNPYLADPAQQIKFVSNTLELGEISAKVAAYNLSLQISKGYTKQQTDHQVIQALEGARVEIYRKGKSSLLPTYEAGKAVSPYTGNNSRQIATGITRIVHDENQQARAEVQFEKLVHNLYADDNGDSYWIKVTDPKSTNPNDAGAILVDETFAFNPHSTNTGVAIKKEGTDFTYNVKHKIHIPVSDPPRSTLSGRLLFRWQDGKDGAFPLSGVEVKLVPYYVFEDPTTEKVVSAKTSSEALDNMIHPVDDKNQGVAYDPNDRFKGRPPIRETEIAHTTTAADGYFEFKEFALYDSVFVYEGLYNLEKLKEIPVPSEQQQLELLDRFYQQGLHRERFGDDWSDRLDLGVAGQVTNSDLLGNWGLLSSVGGGLNVHQASSPINQTVNATKVSTKGGQSTILTQQFFEDHKQNFNIGAIYQPIVPRTMRSGPALPDISEAAGSDYVFDKPMRLKKVFRLVVNDNRFCSPDDNIDINPFEQKDVGSLYSLVNSYKIRTKAVERKNNENQVQRTSLGNDKGIWDVQVVLQRKVQGGNKPILPGEKEEKNTTASSPYEDISRRFTQQDVDKNVFQRLVRGTNYKILAQTNDTINTTISYHGSSGFDFGGSPSGIPHGKVIFNADFDEQTEDILFRLEPKAPIVAGRLLNNKGNRPIDNVLVYLKIETGTNGTKTIPTRSDDDGYFVFNNVPEKAKMRLETAVQGYRSVDTLPVPISSMQKGQKFFKDFFFEPSTRIKGWVVNEKGEQVEALVKVDQTGQITPTVCHTPSGQQTVVFNPLLNIPCKGNFFEVYAPSKQDVRLIVQPKDIKYFADTILLSDPGEQTDLKNIVVKTREHRMRFEVTADMGTANIRGKNIALERGLAGTRIEILDTVLTTVIPVNHSTASVRYQFANITQHNFWVKVIPPEGSGYVVRDLVLTNHESKTDVVHRILLQPGDELWGKVSHQGQAVHNAEVLVNMGESVPTISTRTDREGNYRLKGIPQSPGQVKVQVSAPDDQQNEHLLIGKTLKTQTNKELNIELGTYDKLDLSRILGYRVHVTELTETSGVPHISGYIRLDEDRGFSPADEDTKLSFSKIAIRANASSLRNKQGIPYAEPHSDISLDQTSHRLRFGAMYNVSLEGDHGVPRRLALKKNGALSGTIVALARIVDNSFNFPSSYLSFSDDESRQFHFAEADGSNFTTRLSLFTKRQEDYTSTVQPSTSAYQWHFSDAKGQALSFRYLGFKASSTVKDNYFASGKIHIRPTIHANISNLDGNTLDLQMPATSFDHQQIADIQSDQPLSFKLEKWTVNVGRWQAGTEVGGIESSKTGLVLPGTMSNSIRTDAGLSIPFETFRLMHLDGRDELLIEGAQPQDIRLGGFHPVAVDHQNTRAVFGLDNKTGSDLKSHYVLHLLAKDGGSVGKIEKLPGFSQAIGLQAITLISNGQQYISFASNTPAQKMYRVVDFKPQTLANSEGGFALMGNMDFGIPNLPDQYGGFSFTREAGKTKAALDIKELSLVTAGNVRFTSQRDPQNDNGKKHIRDGELELWGTVTEPDKLGLIPVRLLKKESGSAYQIDIKQRDPIFNMDMANNMSIKVSNTNTSVKDGRWDKLKFKGLMNERFASGGMKEANMDFVVHGDIVANSERAKIDKIQTPFGAMTLVLNWQKKELHGTLDIADGKGSNIKLVDGVEARGMAEMNLSPDGFYVMAQLDAKLMFLPSPFNSLQSGIILGYHDRIPQVVFERATRHMYQPRYPCGQSGVDFKGFMIAAHKNIIEPVGIELDFMVIKGGVRLEAGSDITVWANFAGSPNMAIYPSIHGKAYASVSTITCTSLSGSLNMDMTGEFGYNNSGLRGIVGSTLNLNTHFRQQVPALVGCGPDIININPNFRIAGEYGFENKKPFFRIKMGDAENEKACK